MKLPLVHFVPDAYGLYRLHVARREVSDSLVRGEARTRLRNASGEPFTLTVYSNAPSLEVLCNGEPTGVVWKFPVRMGDGPTTFQVRSPGGTTDEVTWLPISAL